MLKHRKEWNETREKRREKEGKKQGRKNANEKKEKEDCAKPEIKK